MQAVLQEAETGTLPALPGQGPAADEETMPPTDAEPATLPPVDPDATVYPTQATASRSGVQPRYEVLGELGRGGMGVVYRARHRKLDCVVAPELILAGGHVGPEGLARFQTEAKAAASLHHPYVVPLLEFGEHNGLPYFTLEIFPAAAWPTGCVLFRCRRARRSAWSSRFHWRPPRPHLRRAAPGPQPGNVLLTEDGRRKSPTSAWPAVLKSMPV